MVKKKISLTKLNCFMKAKTTSCVCCFNILKSSRALCPHFSGCFNILKSSRALCPHFSGCFNILKSSRALCPHFSGCFNILKSSRALCPHFSGCFNILKSSRALCSHFSVCFSILITSLGEEGAGLCASRTFVCLFCACMFFVLFLFLLVSMVGCGL